MRRRILTALLAMSALACSSIDSALEGPVPSDNRISVGLENGALTVAQGAQASVAATVTSLADYSGPVDLTVDGAPPGISVEVAPPTTNGKATTAALSVKVAPDVKVGTYIVTVRARGTAGNVAATILSITIVEPPSFTMALSRSAVTLPPGNSAPIRLRLSRTNLTAPIQLSATAPSAVQASFKTTLIPDDTASFTVIAVRGAPPGVYDVTISASAAGIAERSVTLRVTVTSDAMVIFTDSSLSIPQGQSASTQVVVACAENVGNATLRAEGLPAGISATFTAGTSDPRIFTAVFTASGSVAPGTYHATLRASASGFPDATADLPIVVTTAGISLSLNPSSVTMFVGSSAVVTASIARTDYAGNVSITVENLPAGMTASVAQFDASTNTAKITLTAGATLAPGQFTPIVRATPTGLSTAAAKTATIDLTVRAAPTSSGNVLLDWSRCTAPDWVAGQDGTGPWIQLQGTNGVYRFNVAGATGGFAWVDGGNTVNARFLTQAQLTAAAIDMCGNLPGTKSISGTAAVHSLSGNEQFFWNLGGGIGISTPQNNNFSIDGVKSGVHDLVAWAQSGFAGARGYIRRDLDLPHGTNLGTITITGTDGFPAVTAQMGVQGQTFSGDFLTYGMRLLTGAGCDDNFLYTSGGFNVSGPAQYTSTFSVMPQEQLRPTDLHYFTVTLSRATVVRTSGVVAHNPQGRTNVLAPNVTTPTVTYPAGAYKRIAVAYASDVSVRYNDMLSIQYSDGRSRFMNLSASKDYFGTGLIALTMPDLSSVAGFPLAAALPSTSNGTFTSQLTGSDYPGSLCREGNTTVSIRHLGTF